MSTLDNVTPFPARRPARRPALSVLTAAVSNLRRFVRLRRARQDLHELPDYLLADIGLDRSKIDEVTAFGLRRRH